MHPPDNLTLIAGLLRGLYRVVAANHGEKAIAIAHSEHPPDLILLDIMMPGLSGHEVCQRPQGRPGHARYSDHLSHGHDRHPR